MVREVKNEEAEKFLKKSEEFYGSALENYQKGMYNVSIFNSSQSVILANDAFCIFYLGRRASKDHREAIQMHVQASFGKQSKKEIIAEALEKRSEFGYTQKEGTDKEANLLLIRAKRFLDWVKSNIK
ncbi:MAG TPA: HEPN domain-containing protein [archaeon]|nr:HEPN domain-containing protein [archaeon]